MQTYFGIVAYKVKYHWERAGSMNVSFTTLDPLGMLSIAAMLSSELNAVLNLHCERVQSRFLTGWSIANISILYPFKCIGWFINELLLLQTMMTEEWAGMLSMAVFGWESALKSKDGSNIAFNGFSCWRDRPPSILTKWANIGGGENSKSTVWASEAVVNVWLCESNRSCFGFNCVICKQLPWLLKSSPLSCIAAARYSENVMRLHNIWNAISVRAKCDLSTSNLGFVKRGGGHFVSEARSFIIKKVSLLQLQIHHIRFAHLLEE